MRYLDGPKRIMGEKRIDISKKIAEEGRGENKNLPCIRESILLKYEKFITGYEGRKNNNGKFLGKVLSEKTEAIYKDITGGLIYPIKIVKLDPENEEDCSRPVAMDTGKKEFIVKVDNTLADNLFENALIRDIIYCQQMSNNAPVIN